MELLLPVAGQVGEYLVVRDGGAQAAVQPVRQHVPRLHQQDLSLGLYAPRVPAPHRALHARHSALQLQE